MKPECVQILEQSIKISYAVKDCNEFYRESEGFKELRIKEVQKSLIVISYGIGLSHGITHEPSGRDLSRFARFLLRKRGWVNYTTFKTNLFRPLITEVAKENFYDVVEDFVRPIEPLSDEKVTTLMLELIQKKGHRSTDEDWALAEIKKIIQSIKKED